MPTRNAIPLNPFLDDPTCVADEELVARAKNGDGEQLGILLTRLVPWVLNLAMRMLHRRADAEDSTQEVLLKAIKALPKFREAKFRTWLYRIVANHLLSSRKSKWAASEGACSFAIASAGSRQVPDLDPPDPRTIPVPMGILAQEVGANCMIETPLRLDGLQRLAYILGEVFQVSDLVLKSARLLSTICAKSSHALAATLRNTSAKAAASCIQAGNAGVSRKTRAVIQAGFLDPNKLEFTQVHTRRVKEWLLSAHQNSPTPMSRSQPTYTRTIRFLSRGNKPLCCVKFFPPLSV